MTTKKLAPTPAEIDSLCSSFDSAKIAVEKAEQALSTAKGNLLAAIQDFGYVPAGAEKTTRLEGTLYIADATVASTIEIKEAPVAELQSELSRLNLPKVFARVFARKVKHSLQKNAEGALKLAIGGLNETAQTRLLGIYAACFRVGLKAPALSVELASALREKEEKAQAKAAAKAEKAAKKAARAAGKKAA
jgi:hypothetical protein